jgi:hypothetical protein
VLNEEDERVEGLPRQRHDVPVGVEQQTPATVESESAEFERCRALRIHCDCVF